LIRIAGTGSRQCNPISIIQWLDTFIEPLNAKETHFITGGAVGFDMVLARWCAERNISYEIILPFPYETHTKMWHITQKIELKCLLQLATKVTVLSDIYGSHVYLERNRKMVDMADIIIAYWNGKQQGGTYYTIEYAKKKKKRVIYYEYPYPNFSNRTII
jgi:uncharacterized phage-like protein YoqJ